MGTSTVTATLTARLLACLALLGYFSGSCLADEATPRASTDGQRQIRVVLVSELPEAITYYDQGFADFIRASKSVPLVGINFSRVTQDAVIRALSERHIAPSLVPVPESFAKQRAEIVAAAREKVWSSSVYESTKALLPQLRSEGVDAVVVVSPSKTPSERYMEGLAVMTKIGLLGINKASYVFTMVRVEVYAVQSAMLCSASELVARKRIPAIYSDWKTDMTSGPTDQLSLEMQVLVSSGLAEQIAEAFARAEQKVLPCIGS